MFIHAVYVTFILFFKHIHVCEGTLHFVPLPLNRFLFCPRARHEVIVYERKAVLVVECNFLLVTGAKLKSEI